MGKEEIKAVGEILSSKAKFKRAAFIVGMICITIIIIAGIAFYTGAISWHGGK